MINIIQYFTAAVIALSPVQDSRSIDPRPAVWNTMVSKLSTLPKGEQLRQVNSYFNHKPYFVHPNPPNGRPLADIVAKGGNCVDFAMAKHQMLLDLGWKPEELVEVSFVRPGWQYGHRTLAVHAFGTYQILDLGRDEPVMWPPTIILAG
jgi:predicted transglutaminase-like cysteine proteinase